MIKKNMTYETALGRTAALCSAGEHCIHELREKMAKWNVLPTDADRVIEYLIEEKYIDEKRFCRAYASDKLRYNHWGRVKIVQMLKSMQLNADDIDYGIGEIDEEEYMDILHDILNAKIKSVKAKSDYERNGKLIRFAIGRGFEMALVCKILNTDEFSD